MFKWLRELLELRTDYIERRKGLNICESCETLKIQLAIANEEKKQLLNRILEKPALEEKPDTNNLKPLMPKLPWKARQHMLEKEDRRTAQLLKQQKESVGITTEELEQEMSIVKQERETGA